jgi:hypothetical protein
MIKTRLFALLIVIAVFLGACNLPKTFSEQGASLTAAAQAVQAMLTQTPGAGQVIITPSFTTAPGLPPTLTPIPPSFTPLPSATSNCDAADFITDVTIPDGTVMTPGQAFTKTWRLKNIGTCSWTPSYAVVFSNGNSMSGPASQALAGNVNPGQTIDISVNLTAPGSPGDYTGNWKLRNSSGVLFARFYVQINVQNPTSSGFDLHTRAPQAEWKNGAGSLTFGGPDSDANGFAMYQNNQKLEDGSTPGKILETHPQWVDDGVISGLYPAYMVVAGEHFIAKIGFLALSDGTCGTGNATFQLNYKEGGVLHPLGSWTDTCDGALMNVDVNVSSIAGHSVQFALAVIANGSSGQDWAVWVSPRVEIP